MSFSLYGRPAPTDTPDSMYLGQLKYKLAPRLWDHDGSLRSEPLRVDRGILDYLRGIHDATGDEGLRQDAKSLIDLIEANPQGVDLWIGDEQDGP